VGSLRIASGRMEGSTLRFVRSAGLLLVLLTAVGIGLWRLDDRGSPRHEPPAAFSQQERAERALTLLDVWAQSVVPAILLEHAEAHALQVGHIFAAAQLEQRMRAVLQQVEGFQADVEHDPALRKVNSGDVRAVRAASAAWVAWASAMLRPQSGRSPRQAQWTVTTLEAHAVRLHQAAYAAVDSSLRASIVAKPAVAHSTLAATSSPR
jgi:hypothetical protein